jgi:putative ABC transport system ATP-binding protein
VTPVVELAALEKRFSAGRGEVHALRGIDLAIGQGEFVAIMGPSGSGKTTLMEIVGCLSKPSAGTYRFAGRDVSGIDADGLSRLRGEQIGFVFQSFNLLPQISAWENVEMPLLFGGVSRRKRRERVGELLDRVGLADRMHHKPTELSGGEMQRVATARALAMDPAILLADEPTGNLDSTSGSDVMTLFQELHAQGRTILVITHDPALARRAPRRVEIHDGRITSDTRA